MGKAGATLDIVSVGETSMNDNGKYCICFRCSLSNNSSVWVVLCRLLIRTNAVCGCMCRRDTTAGKLHGYDSY